MELLLIRHGIAEDRRPGRDDADRALTAEGRSRLGEILAALLTLRLHAAALLHSPWRRAAETATLLAPLASGALHEEPTLAAPPGPDLLARLASWRPPTEAGSPEDPLPLALVGHEPWLGELAALLCLGEVPVRSAFRIRKGGVLGLRGDPRPGGMEVELALRPALLRRIAGLG